MAVVVPALMALGLMYWGWSAAGKPWNGARSARGVEALARAADGWMRMLNETRQFPRVDVGGMLLPRDETALFAEQSTMIEQKSQTSRDYGGTRVMIASALLLRA